MVDGDHQRMPTNDTSDKPTDKAQGSPAVSPAATPRSRSVAPPISQLGLPTVKPERDMKPLLFDTEWYLQQNVDVAKALLDPVQHYLKYGAAEGRNPNPLFNTRAYLAANADVRGSPLNPFLHFVLYGFREGRDPSPPLKEAPVKKPAKAAPRKMVAPTPPELPTEEKLRQTLLSAMFTAAAGADGNDNKKEGAAVLSEKVPMKPPVRSRSGARKRP